MDESASDSVPAVDTAETKAGDTFWRRRLQDRYTANPFTPAVAGAPPTDAEKYLWIRANRGSFAIADALSLSDRDGDFDARIEAAMRLSQAGRHVHVGSLRDMTA